MLNRVGSICGVVGLVITVIGWLGISPEIVGQRIYDVLYVTLPFASGVFGLVTGWSLHGLLVDAQAVKAAAIEKAKQDGETARMELAQIQKKQEREEAQAIEEEKLAAEYEKRMSKDLQDFKADPCGEKKAMAAAIYKLDKHRAPITLWGEGYFSDLEHNFGNARYCYDFFELDARGDFIYVGLASWVMELFKAYPEQLDEFTEEMKQEVDKKLRYYNPF